jgi:hypothetical protein
MKKLHNFILLCFYRNKNSSSIYPPPTGIRVLEPSSFKIKLKNFVILTLLSMFFVTHSLAQSPPPINPNSNLPQWRGMYVSCGDELIKEIYQNNNHFDSSSTNTLKTKELFNYATSNYFSYLAVYSLAKKFNVNGTSHSIIGDSTYWDALREFLLVAHQKGIAIGMVVGNKDFLDPTTSLPNYSFSNSPFYYNFSNTLGTCPYDTSEVFAFMQANINTEYINPDVAANVDPESEYFNVDEFAIQYPKFERAEMLKGILRMMKYTFDTKKWLYANNDCADCSDDEYASKALPPLGDYAFDYISVEYEYWDDGTINNFTNSTPIYKTVQKSAWDNFIALSQMAFFAERMMCGQIKTELELVLKGLNYDTTKSYPINQWDTAAGNVPWVSEQAAFIGKYYNRILLTDYRPSYNRSSPLSMIRKVAAGLTKLHNNPSSLAGKNEIIPLFSAASNGEKRHCFGTVQLEQNGDTAYWPNNFFGPYLNSTISPVYAAPNPHRTDSLCFFEWEFNYQHDSAAAAPYFTCDFCEEYLNDTTTTCEFQSGNNYIGAFMWYNYATLNNPTSVPGIAAHQYHRKSNALVTNELTFNNTIDFNAPNSTLQVLIHPEEKTNNTLTIYDSNGRVVMNKLVTEKSEVFSLNHLPVGIYVAKLSGQNSLLKKIIKINGQ